MKKIILIVLAFLLLSSCGDECSSYSDFSCKQIEKAKYNIYFYYPDQTEVYLGKVNGLGYCGNKARSFADSKGILRDRSWSYICCMIAKGSSCYEKHR